MTTKNIASFILLLLITILLFDQAFARQPSQGIIMNFRDVEIATLVEKISELSGQPVIVDNRVRGAITIISDEPVAHDRVLDIILSALRLSGFAAVSTDDGLYIIPAADASKGAGAPSSGVDLSSGAEIVTSLIRLRNADAEKMVAVLKPYISKEALLTPLPGQNTLLITDHAQSVVGLQKLVARLDKPMKGEITVIALEKISPFDLINYYERLYVTSGKEGDKGGGARYALVPDPHGNRLIVRSADKAVVRRLEEVAALLQSESDGQKEIHIVRLSFATAKDVASTLKESLAHFPPPEKGKKYTALADEATKTVVVHAPSHVFDQLKPVIESLDVEKRQIYVEALIAEIQSSQIAEFGIQWQSMRGMDPNRAPGPTGVGGVSLGPQGGKIGEAGQGSWPIGASVGVVSGVITMADGTVVPNILALANALATKTQANILSTPTLMALDNEEAEIVVGQNVPLVTGSYAPSTGGASGSVAPFQTIERRDIGLSLKIKPQISPQGVIKLDIYQEVSSLLPTTVQTGASDVVINKRSLESSIIIRDRQLIALGGLVQEDVSVNEDKVPLLGDIPIIGHLFRYETRKRVKSNLLIFLQPRLISTAADAMALAQSGYSYIQREQGDLKVYDHLVLPDTVWPQMPGHGNSHPSGAAKPASSKTGQNEKGDGGQEAAP